MQQIAAVILARMSSSRLPGKPLQLVQGLTMLECIVERLGRTQPLGLRPILATSTDPTDDVLARAGLDLGIEVFRGDREDVLGRFVGAAQAFNARYAARVNGDSPLLEPTLMKEAVEFLQSSENKPVLVSSKPNDHLPYGVSVEVADVNYLEAIHASCGEADREHVTSVLYRVLRSSQVAKVGTHMPRRPSLSLAVDNFADLQRINQFVRSSGLGVTEVSYWDLPTRSVEGE